MSEDFISRLEYNIPLFESNVDFQDILGQVLAEDLYEKSDERDDKSEDISVRRKRYFSKLQYRFKIYDLDILSFDNGDAMLTIDQKEKYEIKKYLHQFLLYFDIYGATDVKKNSSTLFEKISMNAVKNYLGNTAKDLHIDSSMLNENFIKEIVEELSERFGTTNNLPSQAKDDGVDFIVYKPLDMRKKGNVVILGQATLGKNFKCKKPILSRWRQEYITFHITPISCLSIVRYLTQDTLQRTQSDFESAIVFDRGRVMKYYNPNENKNLNNEICSCVEDIYSNSEIGN